MPHVLTIDQGTTGSTALVMDSRGRVTARAYREFTQYFPKPGWVEHDPEEIWEVSLRLYTISRTTRKHRSAVRPRWRLPWKKQAKKKPSGKTRSAGMRSGTAPRRLCSFCAPRPTELK